MVELLSALRSFASFFRRTRFLHEGHKPYTLRHGYEYLTWRLEDPLPHTPIGCRCYVRPRTTKDTRGQLILEGEDDAGKYGLIKFDDGGRLRKADISSSDQYGVFRWSGCDVMGSNSKSIKNRLSLKVVSWNVLASEFTHHNSAHHGGEGRESEGQAKTRYRMAHAAINRSCADVIALQEVSPSFFSGRGGSEGGGKEEWESILRSYHLYSTHTESSPGTALLISKAIMTERVEAYHIDGSALTGGLSKSATIVPVDVEGGRVWVVSIHTAFNGAADKRLFHLNQLEKLLQSLMNPTDGVVIAGDFNCHASSPQMDKLRSESLLKSLSCVELPSGVSTALSGDFKYPVTIDHIFYSSFLTPIPDSIATEKAPSSPYCTSEGEALHTVVGASDHVWLSCTFTRPSTGAVPPAEDLIGRVIVVSETVEYRVCARSQTFASDFAIDIGSSYGESTAILARYVSRTVGFDISDECVAESSMRYPHLTFIKADCFKDPERFISNSKGCNVCFIDIGGDRIAIDCIQIIEWVQQNIKPEMIVMKSRKLYKALNNYCESCDLSGTCVVPDINAWIESQLSDVNDVKGKRRQKTTNVQWTKEEKEAYRKAKEEAKMEKEGEGS